MKILILGAGKMGSFFTDLLSFDHEVAVLENDPKRMRFIYPTRSVCRSPKRVAEFKPELVINCVTLSYTIEAFQSVMPLPASLLHHLGHCLRQDTLEGILRDMRLPLRIYASDVRTDVCQLGTVGEGKHHHHLRRRPFGQNLFQRHLRKPAPAHLRIHVRGTRQGGRLLAGDPLRLHDGVCRHDETSGCAGTTFKRHMKIARGLLSRRRLPPDGNPLQPPHAAPNRPHPGRTLPLAGNHQREGFREDEGLPDQNQEKH